MKPGSCSVMLATAGGGRVSLEWTCFINNQEVKKKSEVFQCAVRCVKETEIPNLFHTEKREELPNDSKQLK